MTEILSENIINQYDAVPTDMMVELLYSNFVQAVKKIKNNKKNIADAIDLIAKSFMQGGKLYIYSTGTAARVAFVETLETQTNFSLKSDFIKTFMLGSDKALTDINLEPEETYNAGNAEILLSLANEKDVIMAIKTKYNENYIKGALEAAQKRSISTILLSDEDDVPCACDVNLLLPFNLKSISNISDTYYSSIQKIVLNMIFSGVMVKIGKVYDGYIVDTNIVKNKNSAKKIVAKITGADENTVIKALEKCNYNPKIAIVMIIKKKNVKDAVELLKKNNLHLRGII